jgi:hypothetical protein
MVPHEFPFGGTRGTGIRPRFPLLRLLLQSLLSSPPPKSCCTYTCQSNLCFTLFLFSLLLRFVTLENCMCMHPSVLYIGLPIDGLGVDWASNRNEYQKSSWGGKARRARRADNFTAICEPIVKKMWELRRLATQWASTACYRDSFTFYFYGVWSCVVGASLWMGVHKVSCIVSLCLRCWHKYFAVCTSVVNLFWTPLLQRRNFTFKWNICTMKSSSR